MRPLLNLLAKNKAASRPLALERTGSEVTIECVGTLLSSDEDARYWGGVSAQSFARELRALAASDTLHIRLSSPGGDVMAGVAMAQAIRECRASVIVHIDGQAASAASVVAAAAPRSIIAPGGLVMIHNAWTIAVGNERDLRQTADLLAKVDGEIAAAYVAKAGGERDAWLEAMAAETWYTGAEAVDVGLVTEIAGSAPTTAAARAVFDLSAFARAPAAQPEQAQPAPVANTIDLAGVRLLVDQALADVAAEQASAAQSADLARRRRVAAAFFRQQSA